MQRLKVIGSLLILIGVFSLAYECYLYTKDEKMAEVSTSQLTTEKPNTVYFSPLFGALFLFAGIAIIVVGNREND